VPAKPLDALNKLKNREMKRRIRANNFIASSKRLKRFPASRKVMELKTK